MKRVDVVLTGICLLLVVTAFSGFITSEERELSSAHSGWNGGSQFYDLLEEEGAVPVYSPAECSAVSNATLIFVEPGGVLTENDRTALRTMLSKNGRVICFARKNEANEFLRSLGSTISVIEGNISGVDVEYANPKMLYAYPYEEGLLPEEIQKVVTNHPSSLEGGTTILTTPVFSWSDQNGDGSPGADELFRRFTIMACENISSGQIFVLSDTGMLLNAMQSGVPLQDNPRLFAWLGTNTTLFYDTCYSEPFQTGGFSGIISMIKNRTVIKIITVFLIICGICAAYIWVDRKNRQELLESPPETPQENKRQ